MTLNTRWTTHNDRTYMVVSVTADAAEPEASASQVYLDIQMPQHTRIRHIGTLPSDGHGNTIGVDIPDLAAGDHVNLVFRVRASKDEDQPIAPELHLHWIDSASGDLMERHQTGSPMPTSQPEVDDDLTEIVANARSERKHLRRTQRQQHSMKEKNSMNTERQPRTRRTNTESCGCGRSHAERRGHRGHRGQAAMLHRQEQESEISRRPYRRGDRPANREAFMAGREFGGRGRDRWNRHHRGRAEMLQENEQEISRRPYRRGDRDRRVEHESGIGRRGRHAGRHAHAAWESKRDAHGQGRRHQARLLADMSQRIEELEARMRKLQRKAKLQRAQGEERIEVRKIVRTRREPGRERGAHRYGRRMYSEGRKMGRMAHHAFADREGRRPEA